jgi:hypothetical protein
MPIAGERRRDEGAHGRVDALVVNNLGDGFVDVCRRDAGRLDAGSEPGIQALLGAADR